MLSWLIWEEKIDFTKGLKAEGFSENSFDDFYALLDKDYQQIGRAHV